MKKIILIPFYIFILLALFGADLPKVTVSELKVEENFDRSSYGARLEPNNLYTQYSPISGYVTDIYAREGSFVKKDDPLMAIVKKSSSGETYNAYTIRALSNGIIVKILPAKGQEVFEKNEILSIANVNVLKAGLLVSDKDIININVSDTCYLEENSAITGYISKKFLIPEEKTGLFRVEVVFNWHESLFVGKFVVVEIRTNYTKGLTIVQNHIVNKYGKTFIFIIKDNTAYMKEVKIIKAFGNKVIIEGVEAGEKYVTYTDIPLKDGDKVIVEKPANNKKEKQ